MNFEKENVAQATLEIKEENGVAFKWQEEKPDLDILSCTVYQDIPHNQVPWNGHQSVKNNDLNINLEQNCQPLTKMRENSNYIKSEIVTEIEFDTINGIAVPNWNFKPEHQDVFDLKQEIKDEISVHGAADVVAVKEEHRINSNESFTPESKSVVQDELEQGSRQKERPKAKSVDSAEKKCYKCGICSAVFSQSGHFNRHRRTHTGEKPFSCDVCGMRFSENSSLKRHISNYSCSKHNKSKTGDKPFNCDICGMQFTANCSLKRHRNKRHMIICPDEKQFFCDVCDGRFVTKANLERHKAIHIGQKDYLCEFCGVSFAQKGDLTKHRRTHTGEKVFTCDDCGRKFSRSCVYQRHRRRHTGEKNYKCDICGLEFGRSFCLKTHRTIHSQERQFECNVCGAKFITNSQLKHHVRTHTGEEPYACDVCKRRFVHRGAFLNHKRKHILGMRAFLCDLCGFGCNSYCSVKTHVSKHTKESRTTGEC